MQCIYIYLYNYIDIYMQCLYNVRHGTAALIPIVFLAG